MIVDDFDRFEEDNNINIYDLTHSTGNVEYINYGKNNGFTICCSFTYYRTIQRICNRNITYISNLLEFDDLKNLVEINGLNDRNLYNLQDNSQTTTYVYKKMFKNFLLRLFENTFFCQRTFLNKTIVQKANSRLWIW